MTRDGRERMLTRNDEAATNSEGKKNKKARNTLKVVRMGKILFWGCHECQEIRTKYWGGGHYGLKYFILFPTTRGVKGL
jgi:uncharacterized protein with PIN domain